MIQTILDRFSFSFLFYFKLVFFILLCSQFHNFALSFRFSFSGVHQNLDLRCNTL